MYVGRGVKHGNPHYSQNQTLLSKRYILVLNIN